MMTFHFLETLNSCSERVPNVIENYLYDITTLFEIHVVRRHEKLYLQ